MRAFNLLDTRPAPQAKPLEIQGPTWPAWVEDPRRTYQMQLKAERIAKMRADIAASKQRQADAMHAIGYATHMANALEAACRSVGVELEWVTERSRGGNLLRGGGRTERRTEVFRILRARGYSYPEIGLAFHTNASTVQTALKIHADGLTRTHNGA